MVVFSWCRQPLSCLRMKGRWKLTHGTVADTLPEFLKNNQHILKFTLKNPNCCQWKKNKSTTFSWCHKRPEAFQTLLTSWDATSRNLPKNEPEAVHVGHDVGLKMSSVQSLVQNLRRHVTLCANPCVGRDVDLIGVTAKVTDEKIIVH